MRPSDRIAARANRVVFGAARNLAAGVRYLQGRNPDPALTTTQATAMALTALAAGVMALITIAAAWWPT